MDEKIRKTIQLIILGQMTKSVLEALPCWCWWQRRYQKQFQLEVIRTIQEEFPSLNDWHETVRKIYPDYPEGFGLYRDILVENTKRNLSIFGWRKRYNITMKRLDELMK